MPKNVIQQPESLARKFGHHEGVKIWNAVLLCMICMVWRERRIGLLMVLKFLGILLYDWITAICSVCSMSLFDFF